MAVVVLGGVSALVDPLISPRGTYVEPGVEVMADSEKAVLEVSGVTVLSIDEKFLGNPYYSKFELRPGMRYLELRVGSRPHRYMAYPIFEARPGRVHVLDITTDKRSARVKLIDKEEYEAKKQK